MRLALQIEKDVNASLLHVHEVATQEDDPAFADFIEGEFLRSQNEQIKRAADLLTQLERCGNEGLGLYLFDKEFQKQNHYESDGDSDSDDEGGYGGGY